MSIANIIISSKKDWNLAKTLLDYCLSHYSYAEINGLRLISRHFSQYESVLAKMMGNLKNNANRGNKCIHLIFYASNTTQNQYWHPSAIQIGQLRKQLIHAVKKILGFNQLEAQIYKDDFLGLQINILLNSNIALSSDRINDISQLWIKFVAGVFQENIYSGCIYGDMTSGQINAFFKNYFINNLFYYKPYRLRTFTSLKK